MVPPSVYCGAGVLAGDTVRGCPQLRFLICGTPSTTWTGNDGSSKNLFRVDDTGTATHAALVGPSVQQNFSAAFGPDGSVRYAYVDFSGSDPELKLASLSADLGTTNWTHDIDRIAGTQPFDPQFYGRLIVDGQGATYLSYYGYKSGHSGSSDYHHFLDKIDADGDLEYSLEIASPGLVRLHDLNNDREAVAYLDDDGASAAMVLVDDDGGGWTELWTPGAGPASVTLDDAGDLAYHTGSGQLYKVEDDGTAIWDSTIDSGPSRAARMVRVDPDGNFHVSHFGSFGDNTYRKFRGSDGASLGYVEGGERIQAIAIGSNGEVLVANDTEDTLDSGQTGSHFRFDGTSILWAFSVPSTNQTFYGGCDVFPRPFRGA